MKPQREDLPHSEAGHNPQWCGGSLAGSCHGDDPCWSCIMWAFGEIPNPPAARVQISVPMTPPSVNHYKKPGRSGGWYLTPESQRFKLSVLALAARKNLPPSPYYGVEAVVYLAPRQRLDADNCGKLVCDALQCAGVIHSDAAVKVVRIELRRARAAARARTEIAAYTMDEYVELEPEA